jgi:hypothetical protein
MAGDAIMAENLTYCYGQLWGVAGRAREGHQHPVGDDQEHRRLFVRAGLYVFPQIPAWIGKVFSTYYLLAPIIEISQNGGA